MTFTCHTAINQSTVDHDAPHMTDWPRGIPFPTSLLVDNIRTDKPAYMGSDRWGDVAEWDEPAEKDSIVILTMPNGATMTIIAPDLGDCMDAEYEQDGNWEEYSSVVLGLDEHLEEMMYTALSDARNEAINKWL